MPPDTYHLSPIQQGMFFHWLLDRHSGTDIEQIVAELDEPVDCARLEESWQHALDCFSTLRTAFEWEGRSSPVQYVQPAAAVPFRSEDLRALPEQAREDRVREYLRADRREGFDLSNAPAMRVALFQMEDHAFRMVWSFHHILIDGRSFETILTEVFDAYEGGSTTPTTDRPYREFIEWVGAQDSSDALQFWRKKLDGFTATTPLLHDPGSCLGGDPFGERHAGLSVQTTQRLRDLAVREKLSLNTLIMSAWALLLARYSGEPEVVFGVTKTTRRGTIADADSVVGLFLATIPVRIAVDADMPVRDWLRSVREEWVSLRGQEHLPLVEIKHVSNLPPSAPLFETFVMFENYQIGTRLAAKGGAWTGRRFTLLEQPGYPLALMAYGDEKIALKIDYDRQRFTEGLIERILGHLSTILDAWGASLDGPVWQVPILTNRERHAILEEWNDTAREYPRETPIASLVETHAARTPDAPAVTFGLETVSYREINVRANHLARELRRRGAGPGVLVGIALNRSIEMVVALLAVIKSGAAYVPLDPTFPRDRLAYMIDDSELALLVTETQLTSSIPTFAGSVLHVDAPTWQSNESGNLEVAVPPHNLAYLIYTSGSTGRPKGVRVSRGALINFLWSMRETLKLVSIDRLLAVTTISFDIAGMEIWLPLITGAHTIVADSTAAGEGERLRELIERHDITFLQATPVTWRELLGTGWEGKPNLRCACGGESMPAEIATGLVPRVGRLWNLYGPTETTIWSTTAEIRDANERISIGRPIANTQCYILDDHHQPIPIGVTGELYIGGDGVADGYLKRPELDVEKFITNPFAGDGMIRMYRTGDLARFLPGGPIECLGRTDHQVKIRGFRIELGEIENALRLHPDVHQAVVVARDDASGARRLVGYVVSRAGPLDTSGLRLHLKHSLPAYMVPSTFVNLDQIPLTANGKIDRRALPEPAYSRVEQAEAYEGPRNQTEIMLANIWTEVLGIERTGIHDNFFDLGGDSIRSFQIISRARQLGIALTTKDLFQRPTIAELAGAVPRANGPPQSEPQSGLSRGLAADLAAAGLSGDDLDDLLGL